MRARFVTKHSKVQVLVSFWDKMIGIIQMKATKTNDSEIKKLSKDLILIPRDVQYAALKQYLKQCLKLYYIAFFQWRLLYKNKEDARDELKKALGQRKSKLSTIELLRIMQKQIKSANNNQKRAKLPSNFFKKYGLIQE